MQVALGALKGQGARFASRCLWDTETDSHASFDYKSDSLWCAVVVFGLYTE